MEGQANGKKNIVRERMITRAKQQPESTSKDVPVSIKYPRVKYKVIAMAINNGDLPGPTDMIRDFLDNTYAELLKQPVYRTVADIIGNNAGIPIEDIMNDSRYKHVIEHVNRHVNEEESKDMCWRRSKRAGYDGAGSEPVRVWARATVKQLCAGRADS